MSQHRKACPKGHTGQAAHRRQVVCHQQVVCPVIKPPVQAKHQSSPVLLLLETPPVPQHQQRDPCCLVSTAQHATRSTNVCCNCILHENAPTGHSFFTEQDAFHAAYTGADS